MPWYWDCRCSHNSKSVVGVRLWPGRAVTNSSAFVANCKARSKTTSPKPGAIARDALAYQHTIDVGPSNKQYVNIANAPCAD